MASFSLSEWLLALLIMAVILGTRRLVSRTKPRYEGVPLGVESVLVPLYARGEKRAPRGSSK